MGLVVGFGFKIKLGKSPFAVLGGFRFSYSFTNLKGVDALANPLEGSYYASEEKKSTYAVSAGGIVGLTYRFGR